MRKALLYGITAALLVSLAGCAKEQPQGPAAEPQQTTQQTPAPEIADEPKAETVSTETTQKETPAPEITDESAPEETAAPEISDEPDLFTDTDQTVYATGTVNLRSGPGTSYDKVGSLSYGGQVLRVGIGIGEADGWSKVQLADGSIVYISSDYLSFTKPDAQQSTPQSKPSGGTQQSSSSQQNNSGGINEPQGTLDDGVSEAPPMTTREDLIPKGYEGMTDEEIGADIIRRNEEAGLKVGG